MYGGWLFCYTSTTYIRHSSRTKLLTVDWDMWLLSLLEEAVTSKQWGSTPGTPKLCNFDVFLARQWPCTFEVYAWRIRHCHRQCQYYHCSTRFSVHYFVTATSSSLFKLMNSRAVFVGVGVGWGGVQPLHEVADPPVIPTKVFTGVNWNSFDPLLPMLELDTKGMHYALCLCEKKTCAKTVILHCLDAIFKSQNTLNSKFFRAPPRTPLGSLQRSPRPPSWWGGARCPSTRTPPPPLRASSVGPSGLTLSRPPLLKFDKYSPDE